jgi:hypothetical protein
MNTKSTSRLGASDSLPQHPRRQADGRRHSMRRAPATVTAIWGVKRAPARPRAVASFRRAPLLHSTLTPTRGQKASFLYSWRAKR